MHPFKSSLFYNQVKNRLSPFPATAGRKKPVKNPKKVENKKSSRKRKTAAAKIDDTGLLTSLYDIEKDTLLTNKVE